MKFIFTDQNAIDKAFWMLEVMRKFDPNINIARAQILMTIFRLQKDPSVGVSRKDILNAMTGLKQQTLSKALQEMTAKGWLVFRENPNDYKARNVTFTHEGIAPLMQISKIMFMTEKELLTGLPSPLDTHNQVGSDHPYGYVDIEE